MVPKSLLQKLTKKACFPTLILKLKYDLCSSAWSATFEVVCGGNGSKPEAKGIRFVEVNHLRTLEDPKRDKTKDEMKGAEITLGAQS